MFCFFQAAIFGVLRSSVVACQLVLYSCVFFGCPLMQNKLHKEGCFKWCLKNKWLEGRGSGERETRFPSNLRLTTYECVHLVMRGHFQSCDKEGGHTIRYPIVGNPMLHANLMALYFIERELLPIKVLHCRNRNYLSFWFL